MRTLLSACLALFVALAALPASAETLYLTSLEWPPYTGENLAEDGASAKVLREAMTQAGLELEIKFYPWQRAVNTAKNDQNFIGYFPEYYAESIEKDFIFSEPIGTSPLGFIERKDAPVSWSSLSDLKQHTIGVVSGYVNTDKFDAMMASGELKTEGVADDATNIKKVAAGRIDLAVMDKNVFHYLLQTNPELQGLADNLQFNAKLLENKKLFVCVRKSPEGEAAVAKINKGVAAIDVDAVEDAYIQKALGK